MSYFAARYVNAGGVALGEVQSLIIPFIHGRAKGILIDGLRKELAGDPSHNLGFGLTEETLAWLRTHGIPEHLPTDLLQEVEIHLASPIATRWHMLVKKYATGMEGKLRASDFNEAMLPRLTHENLRLFACDRTGSIGYRNPDDPEAQTNWYPDVTLYDGWENQILRRIRRAHRRALVGALPNPMLNWLRTDGIAVTFVAE